MSQPQCSDYISRHVRFAHAWVSTIHPANACTLNYNYLKTFDMTVRENLDKAPVISGSRDAARMAVLGEEWDIDLEHELMSPYPLFFALGKLEGLGPYTISVGGTLPLMTYARYIEPVESGEHKLARVYGSKVNSMEFSFNAGEVCSVSHNIYGAGGTLDTSGTISSVVNYSLDPVYYSDVDIKVNNVILPEVKSFSFTVSNSLDRSYTTSKQVGYQAYCIREGFLEVSGRLEIGSYALSMLNNVVGRLTGHTIEAIINKTHGGNVFSTITFSNVMFNEYPERLAGIEPYTAEISFDCAPSTISVIRAVTNTLIL